MDSGKLKTKEIRKMLEDGLAHLIPEEDLEMYYENMKAREFYSKEGIKNLYAMICYSGVEQYKKLRKTLWNAKTTGRKTQAEIEIDQLENFFGFELFLNVTGCRSREHAIETIQNAMKRDAMKTMV